MYFAHEELTRAHMTDRLDQARAARRGHHLALARRRARQAQRAGMQARLVLLRSL